MNTKQSIMIGVVALVVMSSVIAGQSASADKIINGKYCNQFCLMDYNSALASDQLKSNHGFNYGHSKGSFGWGIVDKYQKVNQSISH